MPPGSSWTPPRPPGTRVGGSQGVWNILGHSTPARPPLVSSLSCHSSASCISFLCTSACSGKAYHNYAESQKQLEQGRQNQTDIPPTDNGALPAKALMTSGLSAARLCRVVLFSAYRSWQRLLVVSRWLPTSSGVPAAPLSWGCGSTEESPPFLGQLCPLCQARLTSFFPLQSAGLLRCRHLFSFWCFSFLPALSLPLPRLRDVALPPYSAHDHPLFSHVGPVPERCLPSYTNPTL